MNGAIRQRLVEVTKDIQTREIITFLAFDGKRYTIAADARQVLDRDPIILMDEFLR